MANINRIIITIICLASPCFAQSFKPSAPYAGGNSGVAPNYGFANVQRQENTICPTSGRVIRGAGGFLMPNHDCTDNQNNQNN
jgi:hypothetical protein